MQYIRQENNIVVTGLAEFDLARTLECGQCFRFTAREAGVYEGVAKGRLLRVAQQQESLIFYDVTPQEFEAVWVDYFDLLRDYGALRSLMRGDPVLRRAADFAPGIRILRQDGWEALCSFIISQNNNIGRIRGIVQRLCESFGSPLPGGQYDFPRPEALAGLTADDLAPLRCGFRARYILDAAQKVASGQVNLAALHSLPLEQAQEELCQIVGVGPKVAQCALLFGFGRVECFPVDVWIGRAMKSLFPEGLPPETLPYAGIIQQYIFHYVRLDPQALPARE